MIQQIDYFVIAPPLALALVAGLVLMLDAFLPARPRTKPVLGLVTLAGVLVALAFVVAQAIRGGPPQSTFCVPADLAGPARLCSFVADGFTLVFAGVVLVAAVVVVLMSMTELAAGGIPVGEWYFLLLCTLVGAVTLPASRDLIMLVVALELVSLPVFALTAMKRYDGRASEAAVKLFVVSVVSTAVMLFGVSLLYGVAGTVYLSRLAAVFSGQTPAPGLAESTTLPAAQSLPAVVSVGVVLVVAGFAFKIAAVPFHSWAADVYQGAPVPVAALLSVISKAAGFAGLILVLVAGLSGQAATWAPIVGIIAALTMTAGNLLAMRQRSAVRLLAWSSVAQSGYILAPLAVAAQGITPRLAGRTAAFPAGTAAFPAGTAAFPAGTGAFPAGSGAFPAGVGPGVVGTSTAYLVIYAAMNLGAFAVVLLVSRTATRNELDDYRGLVFRRPAAGLALAFCLVCLAGLPPGLAGLFAKVFVFREIVEGGSGWLALIMAVNTVIGLYYYAVWTARLFTPPTAPVLARHRPMPTTWLAIGLAVAVAVLFSIAPQLVLDMTSLSAFG
ncbi:NADH-quinone oxidoreductase subunit N [Nonomuraea angiospora]|uniref:NADH-quinone oxidoreductase subunit N n=1 Tax=Nonomuraea angiospora TaxID=46172 RepID=A0ABR9MAA1_9ACTN|nr:NADH-quinone oxidoreductase subunit N [Nonomuraea angiospora]MBE1589545.1 NADH-quinone oxidoreductase subunit N [Nonomuraea angiospora]